ncbi:MAG: AMP-binding protein, partial [Candidatus Binatia bacterium]
MLPPPEERRRRLEACYPSWRPMTLSQALDAAAEESPDRPFVITDARTYTYCDVCDWSRRLASGLVARGVQPGDHVALILANHPEFVAAKFALARAGAVAVPINFLLRRRELDYILRQSDATLLLTMDRFRDQDYLAELDALMPGWPTAGGGAAYPRLREVFVFPTAEPSRPGVLGLADLESCATPESHREIGRRERSADPEFRSDVIYTSGTTGSPKGVMLTHDMILRVAYASAYWRAFEDGRRFVFALPMY